MEDVRVCGGEVLSNEAAVHLGLVESLSPSSWKSVVAGEASRKSGELE